MKMLRISLAATALLALLAWTAPVFAADPVPPSNPVDAPTLTLELNDQDDDTDLVHFRRYGFRRSYYRRSYYGGGFRYSYYRPYYSYRPYYGYGYSSYYYPRYSYSYYRPSYYSYYTPSYYGGYYGGGYYGGGYYGGYYGGGCGYISGDYETVVAALPLGELPCIPVLPDCVVPQVVAPDANANPSPVMPKVPDGEGKGSNSYRYDGGPQAPAPQPGPTQPGTQPTPSAVPPSPTVPTKGYLVSLPEQPASNSGDVSYRAYGSGFATPRSNAIPTAARTSGFAFPAYGEQPQSSGFATRR